ncbi:hypothetical protein K8R66_00460 [bacterium]|nr:hypothetical protein [bacterium]
MKLLKLRQQNFLIILSCLTLICFTFTFGSEAAEWVEPSVDPPSGNIDPPLNQGGIPQYKKGSLILGSNSTLEGDYDLRVIGISIFDGSIQAIGGLEVNTNPLVVNGVNLNLQKGASLIVKDGQITISNSDDSVDAIFSRVTNKNSKAVYGLDSSVSADSNSIGVFGQTSVGTGVYGLAGNGNGVIGSALGENGIGIWGSAKGVAGRFDGPVYFNPYEKIESVIIEDSHILAPYGFSTVEPKDVKDGGAYYDNTIVTDELCLGALSNEDYSVIESCRNIWPGPNDENNFIWNSQVHPALAEGGFQEAAIRIKGNINDLIYFDNENGYVGINSNNPSSELEVDGDLFVISDAFHIGGFLSANSILVNEHIDMQGNKIINLKDPENDQEAATKAYVDAHTSEESLYWTQIENDISYDTVGNVMTPNGFVIATCDGNTDRDCPTSPVDGQMWLDMD